MAAEIFFVDEPKAIRPGDLVVTVRGWYAGTEPCVSLALETDSQSAICLLENREDVSAAYPHLQTRGFRGILDFLKDDWQRAYTDGKLGLRIRLNGERAFDLPLPAGADWFRQAEARAGARRSGLLPNGSPGATGDCAGLGLPPGAEQYRAYVGLPEDYDLSAASAFFLLVLLGLRQHHLLVDVGCGSLRCGKLLIPYLNAGNYLGIEPNRWLVEEGIARELGSGIVAAKSPRFVFSDKPPIPCEAGPADFALANSIFSHASCAQIAEWLRGISDVLSPAGILAATFVAGAEDYTGSEWVYPGCIPYRVETMRRLAEEAGFTLRLLPWRHLHGQTWAMFGKPRAEVAESLWSQMGPDLHG